MIAVPGFLSAGVDPSTIVNIVNYVTLGLLAGSLVIILLGFIRGLFRGWRYGTYRLVMFAILAAVALFTLQPLVNAIGTSDLAQFGLGTSWQLPVFTLTINGSSVAISSDGTTAFTAISGYIENLCKALNVNMSPADLSAYALSLAVSFLSLVMIMVDAVMIAVFGAFFVFLLWHLAFKRFVRKENRKASYRKGKFVGGLTNCLVSVICLAMLIAPLSSMANSLSAAWHAGQLDKEDQTTLHTVDNSVYQAIDGAVQAYDNSAFAQAFFAWNKDQNGETLDMKLVEFLTSTSVSLGEQEKVQMSFLSEISSLAEVFTIAVQSGVISEDGFDSIKWPLLLTTSAAPEALRSLASSRLVTGVLPYGLSILENIDPISSYIKVGTGIDFSDNNYQLTLEELADIYDEVVHSNLIDGVVDPDTGELGSTSEVAGNVLSEDNASLVASIFESLDGENLKIFDALIESALTIQAYKDYESGKVATDELTIADFLPAVTLADFSPEDGKPTLIPEAYEGIKWGEIFADFFLSTVNLVNVDEDLYLAVCNAIPDWNGETKPFSYQDFLAPILEDGNFEKAEAALVGAPQTAKAAEGGEASGEITPLLGTEFLLNATPKLVNLLGKNLNDALKLSGEDAIDLSPIADEMAADQSTILPEWRALLNVVGDFATTEAGREFLLHVEAMPGIYFAPDKSFVGVNDGLAEGLEKGLAGLDASKLATAIIPEAFEGFLEGENSPIANLGVELTFDFSVPNIGSQLSNLLSTLLDAQDLLAYLASLNGQTLTGGKLKNAISTIADHAGELSDLLVAVATSPMLNPVVGGEKNANLVSLVGLVFSTIGLEQPSNLEPTLSSLAPEATGTEMENFVAALVDVMNSGLVDAALADKVDLASFEDVSFEAAFAGFNDSLIFRDCFGPVLDSLLEDNATFAPFFEEGFSFDNVVDWQKEGQNLDVLISSINELGAAGLLDGGTIDVFNSDPGAVENIVAVLSTSDMFVARNDDGTYTYSFPKIIAKIVEDNLPAGSQAASFFKAPDGSGVEELASDIRSTGVENGTVEEVEASQALWKEEARHFGLILRDLLSLGGLDSIAVDGGISLKELNPEPLGFLLHDATSLVIFGRVLNYSLYSLLSEQIAASFPASAGLSNLAAFYEPTLASYQETIRESGNVFDNEADVMSKLVYAILDPSTGIVNAIGEDNKITLDINDVSPEYLVRPLLQSLSGSYLFNSLAAGKDETAYEGILSSLLEESGLFKDGEALAYVESVRGTGEDFAAVKEAWNVENEAIVSTVAAIQDSGVAIDSLSKDPMSFFDQGASYSLQRAKLENILVAATDSKIIRPALASIVDEAAATLGGNYVVNGDWLIDAEASLYREEARTISYVMMYGSLVGDVNNVSVDTLLASPAAESLLREAAHSYVFNTYVEGEESYPAFVQIVYDALDGSTYYGEKGAELTGNKIKAVIARIDTSAMDDEARFAAWEGEIDSLMDALSVLDRTGLEFSGSLSIDDLFPEGAEASLLDERESDLHAFLDAANGSNLIYPGLASFLQDSVETIEFPNNVSLANANYYYGGRGNAADDYGLLAKPYDSQEMGYLASIVRRSAALEGEENLTISSFNGNENVEILLRNLATSRIFDSLEEEPGTDLTTYTVFESLVASTLETSGFYGSDGDSETRINDILDRALTAQGSSVLMSYQERVEFWNGQDGASGEISNLNRLADALAAAQNNYGIEFDKLSFNTLFSDASRADDVRGALYDVLEAASSSEIVYPAIPLNLSNAATTDDTFSLEGADFYYTGKWGNDLLEKAYSPDENERLSYVAMYAGLLSSADLTSLSDINGSYVGGLLANMSSSYIFNAKVAEGTTNTFVGALEKLLTENATIKNFYYSSENPADAQLGYTSAAEKIQGLVAARYTPLGAADDDVGERNWGDFVNTGDSTVVSLEEIIDSEGLDAVIDGFAGGSAELPASRDELANVLSLINGSPILKDMAPNAIRNSLKEGGGIALAGVDFDRSNPYYAYDELGAAADEAALNIKWFDGEQIGNLVDIVYDAKDLTGLFKNFTTIDRTKIQGIRNLLLEMANSKVFNSTPFVTPSSGESDPAFEVSGVVVDQGFTVFQGVLFYMMVETSLHERAYNPVLDAEKGFASAGAKLTAALFEATGTPETAFGDKASLGETAVEEFVSDGADGGLFTTIFNTLQDNNELKLDFSNNGILKFDDIEPAPLGQILTSLNRVSFCEGVIANGAEYLLGDAINLSQWSTVTTDRKLEGERGSLRLSEIRYVGTGTAPASLYYHLGGTDGAVQGVHGIYSFKKAEAAAGENSLIGPTDVYLDAALENSVFANANIANFSFIYDLSTYHLLTEEQYETGAIPSLVRFLGNVLYDEESQKYDQITSADEFFAPLLDGSASEDDVDYVYEIASFLLNENGFFNANFEEDGTVLATDINADDLAYISGDVLIRNFLKFTISVPQASQSVSVDVGSLFLHETTSDAVQTERNLIASLHESLYAEANMVSNGAVPTFAEREASYPGGLTYLSDNLAAITMAVALYEAASNISIPILNDASDAFKQLWLASDSTLGLMEAVPAGSEAVPVAEASVANNFVTSLVNRSFASGLAYQNDSPNRGFLGFVMAVDGFNLQRVSTVSGLASLSEPRPEIAAIGGSLPSTLAELRADSFLPYRSFYTALYQVLSGADALLDRSADLSYALLVNGLNNEGMNVENADVLGLGATLLDSYFYELLAGGRYIHSQVEIASTECYDPTGKQLSQWEIDSLAGSALDLDGDARYFGNDSYLQQAYWLLA